MTGLDVDTSLELFAGLQEAFDEDKKCEIPFHDSVPQAHEGEASWYVTTTCVRCMHTASTFAACDKFTQLLKGNSQKLLCLACKTYPATFAITLLEKIK